MLHEPSAYSKHEEYYKEQRQPTSTINRTLWEWLVVLGVLMSLATRLESS